MFLIGLFGKLLPSGGGAYSPSNYKGRVGKISIFHRGVEIVWESGLKGNKKHNLGVEGCTAIFEFLDLLRRYVI